MTDMARWVIFAYGMFMLVGGYFGFRKGSMMSLVMGAGAAILVFGALWLLRLNPNGAWVTLCVTSGFLTLTFLLRTIQTKSFMPSGMLFVITVAFFFFCYRPYVLNNLGL
jgi:uncharacterized membrane protein (UPF0136 family)